MTDFPHYPDEITTPTPPQDKLIYSSAPWKIYEQDAGMNERDYAVMLNDVFFCRTKHSQTAHEIIKAIRSRPVPSPQPTESNKNLDGFIITRAELFCLLPKNPPIALLDEMVSSIISDGTVKEHDTAIRNATRLQIADDLEFIDDEGSWLALCRYIESLRSTQPQEPKP